MNPICIRRLTLSAATAALLALSACGDPANAEEMTGTEEGRSKAEAYDEARDIDRAVCVLRPVNNSAVSGTIKFSREEGGIRVSGTVRGLRPGLHGFHVHEFGDVQDLQNGSSAGGHFAPYGHEHGAMDADVRHVGDLGNIEADENGVAEIDKIDKKISFLGASSIVGRAIVVHAGEDTFGQPSGDAGDRVAFGVIGIAEASK